MSNFQAMSGVERIAKRNIKDSVFTNLFSDPEYTIQLYRALHPEDTTSTKEDVRILTLENILLNQPYNDLGFSVGDRVLVFVEAQSTWSYNIVVRGMLYMGQTIQVYLMETGQNVYGSKKLKFPYPEFYVLYTGDRKDHPSQISLTKEFFGGQKCALEATATMIYEGKEGDIISQYIAFTKIYQEQYRLYGRTEKAVSETIRICKDKDVLRAYLSSREKEVVDIMMWLFNQEYATDAFGREQREEGKIEGAREKSKATAKNLRAIGMSCEQIAGIVGYSAETVREWLSLPKQDLFPKA